MAIQDRLLMLATDGDPAAITAFGGDLDNLSLVGSAIDLQLSNVYEQFGTFSAGSVQYEFSHRPMWLNFIVTTTVSDQTNNSYVIALLGDDGTSSGNLENITGAMGLSYFNGSHLNAGFMGSVPITPDGYWRRYVQAGVGSTTAVSNEAGRFDIWLGIDPIVWTARTEGRN